MLNFALTTARRTCLIISLAVFFSSGVVNADDSSLQQFESDFSDLIYRLSRSIVTVESSIRVESALVNGLGEEAVHNLVSSGIIYDTLGHIVVDATSVMGRDRIAVRFENYTIPADLVGIDYQTGLALLKVSVRLGQPASFSRGCAFAGRMVVAIGNAFGLESSPTLGFCAGARNDGTLQFSGPINSGTIGGGLFDLSGQRIGVITGGLSQPNSIEAGLAVGARKIPAMVEHLIKFGDRKAGYVGVTTSEMEISPPLLLPSDVAFAAEGSNSGIEISQALMVLSVVPNSPAEQSGITRGDLLFSINGQAVNSALGLMNRINQTVPGTLVKLGIFRQSGPVEIPLIVGSKSLVISRPEPQPEINSLPETNDNESLQKQVAQMKMQLLLLEYRLQNDK